MKDDAVTPVVGVMLMLTLTIILAAVLMAFAGGMADTKPAAPSVELSAAFTVKDDKIILLLSHNGGESLNPKDIRVTAYVKTAESSGEPVIIKDIIEADNPAWDAGETLILSAEKTAGLLGMTESDVTEAAVRSTPVEIGIYHIPSSNVIGKSALLLEAA